MPFDQMKPPMPEKITFNQIARHPLIWALVIITSLLWVAVFMFNRSNDGHLRARDEEIKSLRTENAQLRKEKEDLYKALLYQKGINLTIESKLDSIQ